MRLFDIRISFQQPMILVIVNNNNDDGGGDDDFDDGTSIYIPNCLHLLLLTLIIMNADR